MKSLEKEVILGQRRILEELDTWLRNKLKYEELDEATKAALQTCRDKLNELEIYYLETTLYDVWEELNNDETE